MSFCISSISNKKILFFILLLECSWLFSQTVDSSEIYKIESITIIGNKRTREKIITRELSKQINDTFALKNISAIKKRSEQNIFNTQLFIYDTIYPIINHQNKSISLKISVKERWYIWPVPVFEIQDRNFNSWWQTKDLFRINYGFALGLDNFTGVKDRLVFLFQRGYSEKYGFSYRIPYLNKEQTIGFNMMYTYGRNNEVTYITEDNVPKFVRQYNKYLRTEHEAKVGIIHRPNLYEQNTLEVLFKESTVIDTVVKLNPDFFGNKRKNIIYTSLQYRYTYDDRDNRIYPLHGWAFDVWIYKDGFDYSAKSPINNMNITASLRKHSQLHKRIFLANMIKGRYMNVDYLSYNFNRSLGYNDYIRGYEYYIIDGQKYILTKNSLRYQIIKPRIYHNSGRFAIKQFSTIPYYAFINIYFDGAYVEDKFYFKSNNLTNSWQYGYGASLDFISYYDLVIRLEYSFNARKENGFFIHATSSF